MSRKKRANLSRNYCCPKYIASNADPKFCRFLTDEIYQMTGKRRSRFSELLRYLGIDRIPRDQWFCLGNVEYLIIRDSEFTDVRGSAASIYRGGR
ncbi:MAG: hypothetical protein AAF623_18540, partial [Planctomycetota bacterium]